jgi:hypothetical protein
MPTTNEHAVPGSISAIEVDLADTALVVHEYADGMFTLDLDSTRLVASAADMEAIVRAFATIGKAKGWT